MIITLLSIALVYTITSITAQPDTPIVTFLFSNRISLEETSTGMIATKKDICCKEIEKGTELTLMYIDRNGNIINK